MKLHLTTTGLPFSAFMCLTILAIGARGDEIGLAIGLNTSASAYKSWDNNFAEIQKTDFPSPIEITFRKEFAGFIGIHSALQYSKRSIFWSILSTRINPETMNIESAGTVNYEKTINFLSMEISPIFFHRLKNISIDARLGLSGDLYLNEWANNFGDKSSTFRAEEANPFVLCFVTGAGIGYIIQDRFKFGLKSSISRTLTDIYKNQAAADTFFLNLHNVLSVSMLF